MVADRSILAASAAASAGSRRTGSRGAHTSSRGAHTSSRGAHTSSSGERNTSLSMSTSHASQTPLSSTSGAPDLGTKIIHPEPTPTRPAAAPFEIVSARATRSPVPELHAVQCQSYTGTVPCGCRLLPRAFFQLQRPWPPAHLVRHPHGVFYCVVLSSPFLCFCPCTGGLKTEF